MGKQIRCKVKIEVNSAVMSSIALSFLLHHYERVDAVFHVKQKCTEYISLFRKLVLIFQPKRNSNPTISPKQKEEEERNTVILLAKLTCMQHLMYEFMEGKKKNIKETL